MPNLCSYQMRIAGKKENLDKWVKKMDDYEEENHFWRIFQAEVEVLEDDVDNAVYEISGDCAWSLYSCCVDGYTDVDLFALNTKDLGISMEAWSEESGMCFQEHYLYKNGEQIVDESVEWHYHEDDDETIEGGFPDAFTYDRFEEVLER